jgi:hypothetical protein
MPERRASKRTLSYERHAAGPPAELIAKPSINHRSPSRLAAKDRVRVYAHCPIRKQDLPCLCELMAAETSKRLEIAQMHIPAAAMGGCMANALLICSCRQVRSLILIWTALTRTRYHPSQSGTRQPGLPSPVSRLCSHRPHQTTMICTGWMHAQCQRSSCRAEKTGLLPIGRSYSYSAPLWPLCPAVTLAD